MSWVLGEIKPDDLKVHLALTELLKDPASQVRRSMSWVLGEIKPPPNGPTIHLAFELGLHPKSWTDFARILV